MTWQGSSPLTNISEFTPHGSGVITVAGGLLTATPGGGIGGGLSSTVSGPAVDHSFVAARLNASNFSSAWPLQLGFINTAGTSYIVCQLAWDGSGMNALVPGGTFPAVVQNPVTPVVGMTFAVSVAGAVVALSTSMDNGATWTRNMVAVINVPLSLPDITTLNAGLLISNGPNPTDTFTLDQFYWGPSSTMQLTYPMLDPPNGGNSGGVGSVSWTVPNVYFGDANLLALLISWNDFIPTDPPAATVSVTDTNGNSWSKLLNNKPASPISEYLEQEIWTCTPNGEMKNGTITITMNQSTQGSALLVPIVGSAGVDGTFTSDIYPSPAGPPTTQPYGTNVTTSQAGDLILCIFTGLWGGAPFVAAGARPYSTSPYFAGARNQYSDISYTNQASKLISPTPFGGTYQTPGAVNSQNFIVMTVKGIPATIPIPDVTGDNLAAAEAAIIAAGFVVGTITTQTSSQPIGTVVQQDPPGGTPLIVGSAINLFVSGLGLQYISGKFVPAYLSKAIVVGDASHINPRIYVPKRDKTIRVLP